MTRAEITFAALDRLSRTRALSPFESIQLEEAVHEIDARRLIKVAPVIAPACPAHWNQGVALLLSA